VSLFVLDELAPGVFGYTVDSPNGLYVPLVIAKNPGNGDVGRYLDSLPTNRRVIVPDVLNPQLAGMLERRGFTLTEEWSASFDEMVPIYERESTPTPGA
jgi:hypothetical protein